MGNDRLTVIIPTWNRAVSLMGAIRSVLNQSAAVTEVLVCDDGSTDDSREAVASIGDPRVRWLAGEHSGLPAVPRNRGIGSATGEWLAFLDSDDEWLPDKFAHQLALSRQFGCQAVCSNALRMVPGQASAGPLLDLTGDRLTFRELLETNLVICSSVMVRSELVSVAGSFPESDRLRACEDYALWLRIATMTDFAVARDPLIVYRDAPDQSIRRDWVDPVAQKLAVLDDFCAWGKGLALGMFLRQASKYRATLEESNAKSLLGAVVGRFRRAFRGKGL